MFCRRLRELLSCLILIVLSTGNLCADDIRLFSDLSFSGSRIESKDRSTDIVTKNETHRYKQNYRLDMSKELFPYLTFTGGAQVEEVQQFNDFDGDESNSRNTSIAPFAEAEWRTALYSLSAGYRERYERSRGSDIDTNRDYIDSYTLRGEWRPVDLPRFDLSYLHTDRHDKPLEKSSETSILQLNSRYDYRDYEFRYSYFRSEDEIVAAQQDTTGSVTNTHNGGVRYSHAYLDGRVTMNAGFRAEYTNQIFSGEGSRDFAVFPGGSSFYTPDSNLNPNNNNSATYADFNSSTQLDLAGSSIINLGLDFGEAVEVGLLKVALSAELDSNTNISDSFNWTVYVSSDQINWVSRSIASVDYLTEENLLELRLNQTANDKYILLVYTPPLNPNQSQPAYISSLRAFVSRILSDGAELSTRSHNAQLGISWKATDKTGIFYDLTFQERQSSLFDDQRVRLNNGLTVQHLINDIFSATGRLSVSDTWEQGDHDSSNYNYSAKLNARYLETLNQSLIYSGGLNREPEGDSSTNSILLHTNAELYRGWDVSLDQGYSWQSPALGSDMSSFFVRIENSLVPHRRFNLFVDYSFRWEKEAGSAIVRSDTGRIRGLWIPSDTLSLSGEVRMRAKEGTTDVLWEYGINWLPFRDGTLQCSLNYGEEEDADGNRTRSFSPNISWDITSYANLSLRYSQGTEETNSRIDEFQSVSANLRITYD